MIIDQHKIIYLMVYNTYSFENIENLPYRARLPFSEIAPKRGFPRSGCRGFFFGDY
jgi:hypothetical protein